jgi:cell division protein FtsI/penicillin-binding protein 2
VSAKRIGILFVVLASVFCALVLRLFQLQLASDPVRGAGTTDARVIVLPAARGAIFDKDGRLLRADRDGFDVHVVAQIFREKGVVDALADLAVLLDEDAGLAVPLERGRLHQELRGPSPDDAIARILALTPRTALSDEADDLHGRAKVLIEPEGTLVRPASHARRRVQDAVLVLASEGGLPAREVRKKLKDRAATVGEASGVTANLLRARIRREEAMLAKLGAELGLGDAGDVRSILDGLCDRHFRRIEIEIERRIDDAICSQHWGTWNLDPGLLSEDAAAEIRRQSGVTAGAPWPEVREALCRQVRGAPGFERSRYLDARKENQTKNELAWNRGDELGYAGSFALAGIVDGPAGLRALGFELKPSFARDESRREKGGALGLMLGEVTRRGTAVGGAEERLDDLLRGEPGEARVAPGWEAEVTKAPRHGASVRLTISLPLQNAIQSLLDRTGAAAVVDVRTGGILAIATSPQPADGEAQSAAAELMDLRARRKGLFERVKEGDDRAEPQLAAVWSRIHESPGVHRAITSETALPPGSTMKALTLLAALEAGVITPSFEIDCQTGEREQFGCEHHGRVDLEGALERSCNEYCYQAAGLVGGLKPLCALYEKIGLFDEVPGLDGRIDWMRTAILGDDARNLAIGQGSFSLSPVRLAGIAASLAHGRVVRPHLFRPEGFEPIGDAFASEANLAVIRSGLRRVAIGAQGTARKSRHLLEPLGISGKTGTAQLSTRNDEKMYAAWFVGFAPWDSPRYGFAVLVSRTRDHGADVAPSAARVIEACYSILGGRP